MSDSRSEIGISEAELRSATRALDELHRATFPAVRATLADIEAHNRSVVARLPAATAGRRGLLLGGLAMVTTGALAACGSTSGGSVGSTGATASPGGALASAPAGASRYTGDLKVVALAAALENLAVAAYNGALKKAGAGDYGTVPPAVAQFVTTVKDQHAQHAQAWNGVLTSAKLPAVTGTPLTIAPTIVATLNATNSVAGVAALALKLETGAASTYTYAVSHVTNAQGIGTAASIAPVEGQHAAILHFILGQNPVPDAFIGIGNAVSPSELTA
ncbi:MAG: ferritin-like domain-containing protein [Frankia sp.]